MHCWNYIMLWISARISHFFRYVHDVPTLCSEMFQIKPYTDKPSAFGLSVHSFVSYERIGKWDEERYRKGGRKPYFIELGGTPRWINLYAVADADVYYNYEA